MRTTLILLAIGVFVWAGQANAQVSGKSKADPKLRQALESAKLTFEEGTRGCFRLGWTFDDDRTHMVIAESQTETLGIMEVREIWAVAWRSDELPSAEIANKLLLDTGKKKIGAWSLQKIDDKYCAVFSVKASTDCDGEALRVIIRHVAVTADEMEKDLTDADEF